MLGSSVIHANSSTIQYRLVPLFTLVLIGLKLLIKIIILKIIVQDLSIVGPNLGQIMRWHIIFI